MEWNLRLATTCSISLPDTNSSSKAAFSVTGGSLLPSIKLELGTLTRVVLQFPALRSAPSHLCRSISPTTYLFQKCKASAVRWQQEARASLHPFRMKELGSKEAFCVCVCMCAEVKRPEQVTWAGPVLTGRKTLCCRCGYCRWDRTGSWPGNGPASMCKHHSSFEHENVLPKTQ